jgi:hypothetical protein
MTKSLLAVTAILLGAASLARGAEALWDDARYMHVADVRPGMTGYGLTVFTGDKIQKFNVEVVGVLRNLVNPKTDVVLIRCKDTYIEHLGPVEGMSGSPIFLFDPSDTQQQHPKMIGAFAYGWEWSKDPLAGVQPIEYMLKIPTDSAPPAEAEHAAGEAISPPRWTLADVSALPGFHRNGAGFVARPIASFDGENPTELRPLTTPLMAGGFSPSALRLIAPLFAPCGLSLEAGGVGAAADGQGPIRMEPGSVLVAPLLTGDMELSAIGTCTEVRGDRVFGFGHEFNNEGPIALPLGSGTIATVVADVHSSFKLGQLSDVVGTLTSDQTVGVAGLTGQKPAMVPITIHVHYTDGSLDQTYHFEAAQHPKFTPLAASAAVGTAIAGVKDLPEFHTLDYDLRLDFADGRSIRVLNTGVNCGANEVMQQIALPIMATSENAFQKIDVTRIEGTINVTAGARLADISSITLPKLKYEPGETIKAFVTYRPWREGERTMPVEFELPKDLPDDQYQLIVSDWERFFSDQRQAEPFRFTAESVDEMFDVLDDFEAVRHNALYIRLVRQADGVAVGRTAMPRLPSAIRQALLASGRSDLTAFVTSSVKTVPTDMVMSGSADFMLTIERQAHVEPARTGKQAATQP